MKSTFGKKGTYSLSGEAVLCSLEPIYKGKVIVSTK